MKTFRKHRIGMIALIIVALYALIGLYAPLLSSSKPLVVVYDGEVYFPLFRYLLYPGFYTRGIDRFFNVLMFTLPLFLIFRRYFWFILVLQFAIFFIPVRNPAPQPLKEATWSEEVAAMAPYTKLNLVLRHQQRKSHHVRLSNYSENPPSLWQIDRDNEGRIDTSYIRDRFAWLENQHTSFLLMPLLRPFHWEEDAGGSQSLNQKLPWWELTRINRKDLAASLLFGIRISLVVGFIAVALSLLVGIPLGAFAGYYGGRTDIFLSRFIEIWESMPTFFMLLMVVAILHSKSIFLVVMVLGIFGWTGFARFLRGEVLKQRHQSYVDASRALGFRDRTILFSHILPNAIPPLLTLLPFSMMAAITSEAGLSFLGLGEEGSTSWGVLMDEGRTAFPHESYLLWPPAIALTILLIAIALVGDALRDALDPKLKS